MLMMAEGQPGIASGGYVKRVISSYVLRLRVLGGEGMPVRVFRAVQFHDTNVSVAPLLPPDVHTLTLPVQIPGWYSLGDNVGGLRSLYNVIFHDPYERGGYWVGWKDDPVRAEIDRKVLISLTRAYAPVVSWSTVCLLLTLSVIHDLET